MCARWNEQLYSMSIRCKLVNTAIYKKKKKKKYVPRSTQLGGEGIKRTFHSFLGSRRKTGGGCEELRSFSL